MIRRLIAPAVVTLALAAGACGGGAKTPAKTTHPTGAADLLVRIEHAGGMLPASARLAEMPILSLYGDGTYITGGAQIQIFPGPALPSVIARKVKEAGLQAILAAAEEAGLTAGSRKLKNPTVMDAGSTVFTVMHEGKTYVTEAEALGLPGGENPAARKDLEEFRDLMGDLERWLPAGSVSGETQYSFGGLRVLAQMYVKSDEAGPQQPKTWPLAKPLAEFGNARNDGSGVRCGIVKDADLSKVLPPARQANQLTPWQSAGKEYSLQFRPLLPDENGC